MTTVLLLVILVLLASTISMGINVYRIRTSNRQRGLFRPWPIRKVALHEFDERFRPDEWGPTLDSEISYVGQGPGGVLGGTSDLEAWILAVLAKSARVMFEFGTCTGKTAYLWARNMPADGSVTTLTLSPAQMNAYRSGEGDEAKDTRTALAESTLTRFRYSGTDAERKIVQLFGDSKIFDETPYVNRCDVVFVDGSHAYSYVLSDSRKALRMVRPGGVVLWHDYSGPRRVAGVYRALNEMAKALPLVHIAGTTFVAYRRPAA